MLGSGWFGDELIAYMKVEEGRSWLLYSVGRCVCVGVCVVYS